MVIDKVLLMGWYQAILSHSQSVHLTSICGGLDVCLTILFSKPCHILGWPFWVSQYWNFKNWCNHSLVKYCSLRLSKEFCLSLSLSLSHSRSYVYVKSCNLGCQDQTKHFYIWHGSHHHTFKQRVGLQLFADDEAQHKPSFELGWPWSWRHQNPEFSQPKHFLVLVIRKTIS